MHLNPPLIEKRSTTFYPMCYNIAKGKTFQEVFNIKYEFKDNLKGLTEKWSMDEEFITGKINKFKNKEIFRFINRNGNRLDRPYNSENVHRPWKYNSNLIGIQNYLDAHSLRPYNKYKKEIDILVNDLLK